ncbi:MAG: SAM-dependent chlorinase/fluorinase, partial [Bergeyella zoohelcum]|nr:SAM-dependent chlorinase/fluorinase [Bergeyella zoohelcum]
MSIITLTSDYGLVDYRVAAVKGAILSQTTNVQIVDISHEIEAYNLTQAAYIVRNAYKHFPKNSVHILCIEAVYRKEVKPIVYKIDGHYFISADNGLLSLIFPDISPDGVYEITLKRFDEDIKSVVMDIFVPVATYLADGGIPEVIGREYKTPKESVAENPIHNESENMIVGRVMYIDNYGNLITNINKKIFTRAKINHERYRLIFRDIALSTIHETQMA